MMPIDRRTFLKASAASLAYAGLHTTLAASLSRTLPADFPRDELKYQNPAEVESQLLPRHELHTRPHDDSIPALPEGPYTLQITGEAENPRTFTLAEITSLPKAERRVLFVSPGFFAANYDWAGATAARLCHIVQPKSSVRLVGFRGVDNRMAFFEKWEVAKHGLLLAYQVNQIELPRPRGFPLRLVAPRAYGCRWIKWLTEIRFIS